MVQIIDEAPKKPRFLDQFLGGIQRGATEGIPMISKHLMGQQQNKALKSFADQLEKNYPNSPQHKTLADLYRSEIPYERKSEIAKSLVGTDPFKIDQQKRLQAQEIRTKYGQRIKEEQAKLAKQFKKDEMDESNRRIAQLQSERDAILGFNFGEDMIQEDADLLSETETAKMKFDKNNPGHMAKFKQLDKKFKGDRKKVNEALSKEFSL